MNRGFPELTDTTGLTDADWAGINRLRSAYETGGIRALSSAFDDLAEDPRAYTAVPFG